MTISSILNYCWHKVLSIYSGNETTVIGMTVSGRNLPIDDIGKSVGLYINTLPVILSHDPQKTVLETIRGLQDDINEINSRSAINLSSLQNKGVRLFNTLFVYENYPISMDETIGLSITFRKSEEKVDYPIGVVALENSKGIVIQLNYASELFERRVVVELLNNIKTLLLNIVAYPEKQSKYLSCIDDDQYEEIVHKWNETTITYPKDQTIVSLFEEQVKRTPGNVALVYEDKQLTYAELNDRSDHLAAYLHSQYKICQDDPIVLCLDRSEQMLIAILGVLKSGGAYVPVDPRYPEERIAHVLSDVKTKVVISDISNSDKISAICKRDGFKVIILGDPSLDTELESCSKIDFMSKAQPNGLAYIIYTSGTTGTPKGVMIEHRNVVQLFYSTSNIYKFHPEDVWTLFHSYTFDFSVWEIWGALLFGGILVIPTYEQTRDPHQFYDLCKKRGVTILNQTPSAFYQFINVAQHEKEPLRRLRHIIFGGEALNFHQLEGWYNVYQDTAPTLTNMYGITETTVHVTYKHLRKEEVGCSSIIGLRLQNYTAYVLDGSMRPVPVGAIGELYIGGEGVSRGYLNRPELTAERFLPNPYQSEADKRDGYNSRLYKTGDLVRYMPDGNLEYIGRNDFQVKIRGFRIELGEIEARLSSYKEIRQVAVLAKKHENNSSKYLVAYYVADQKIDQDLLRNYLAETLPEYMVPSAYVHLTTLPLTSNGKLDRRALPEPEFVDQNRYTAPTNPTEKALCDIYADVLGLERGTVGIDDDFFQLGGDSIISIKLINRISSELGLTVGISSLFKNRTIRGLISCVEFNTMRIEKHDDTLPPTEQILSFAQERLWFINNYEGGTNAYNIPMVFKILPNISATYLLQAINSVVLRHEVLRSIIKSRTDGVGYQEAIKEDQFSLKHVLFNAKNTDELRERISSFVNQVFDLENEIPIRIALFNNAGDNSTYIAIVIHHIAFDGWSSSIFYKEIRLYYDYYSSEIREDNKEVAQPLPIQYRDFALWQRHYLQGEPLEKQLLYWKKKLEGFDTLQIPTDKVRPPRVNYEGDDVSIELSEDLTRMLKEVARKYEVSTYSLLLSAFYILLKYYCNQNDIVIGTPVANRHYKEIEGLIGFFVNTLVLRQNIDIDKPLDYFIKQVGDLVSDSLLHQDVPFE
ncbi:MAG: amino acid adenylation domain-containing protein, partial [Candidatus Saccharibacteria bacterium]|nr:amino acid adenylation domain-containing protein [Candidatus Saccharibacteria bacterium]